MNSAMKKELSSTYDQAIAAIPEALASEGFGVLTRIDIKETLKKKLGVDHRRYEIFGACNPALAHQALSTTLDVGVFLPCNVVVYERDDGRAVVLAIDPVQSVAGADPGLASLAATVREKLGRVLELLR